MMSLPKKQIIERLLDNDGFSLPFKGGKPMRIKDLLGPTSDPSQPVPNKNPMNIGTGRNSNLGILDKKYLAVVFATRYKPHVDATIVKQDIETELLRLSGIKHTVKVEKLNARYDHYASFKITCHCDNISIFMNNAVWPPGVYFRWWIKPRYGSSDRE